MSGVGIVKSFMTALETSDFDSAAKSLDDNFFFGGWVPETLDKDQFLNLMRGLKAGIPDLKFNIHNLTLIKGTTTVQGTMQITGKQTGTIDLSALNVSSVQPTGRSISMPEENVVYVVEIDLITRMTVTPIPNGGIEGLLQQLGVKLSAL